jgi:streptogramin lyase
MVLAHGKAWIADYFGNVLYGVDPATGATESHPIPLKVPTGKPGGAHAMDTTAEGELWVCFTKAEQVGRFDPATKGWKLYSGYPKGGNVQYFVLDKDRNIYRDEGGGIWTTHFSLEALCRLDPATGVIQVFRTPPTEGFPENGVHLYAGVADSKGRIWYTETHGNRLGVLDTRTGEAEEFAPFQSWSGPKRLAIDERDRLWIPHLGVGHVTLFDTRQRKVLREVPIPIPGDYIYAIRRNPHTGDLWLTGAGSDALYRLDPHLFKFRIYRLPRAGAYTRTVAFEENGSVWTNYASFPNLHTQSPHASGVIVRLTPE